MKLIINADDFGLTNGVTYGIYDAVKNGIATSTTMMINTPGTKLAAGIIKSDKNLKVGLHLNLSLGKPLTSCESLVDENGCFIKPKILKSDERYDEQEVYDEFEAQYAAFIALTGKKPTHMDSHLYLHQIFPKVERQAKRLSEKFEIPLRKYDTKYYSGVYFEDRFKLAKDESFILLKSKFKKLVAENSGKEVIELMAHPGYLDKEILEMSSYSFPRTEEGAVLKDPEIKEFISRNAVELISFAELGRKYNG
ncbi:MAG TPA: hypothetical protein DEB10_01810 [Ruminococcaceae bacterium]|jgi:hypothetical protein|nr:hypothetical protein [Oscillospiraceae bacterium]